MLKHFSLNKKQRGISLLEVMLSLAIIAIILVLATRYFGIANRTSKLNVATAVIGEVRQGYTRYQQDKGNINATLSTLAADGYITDSTARGFNPWGGAITPNNTIIPPTLTLDNIPTPDCQNLADRFNTECKGGAVTVPLLQ